MLPGDLFHSGNALSFYLDALVRVPFPNAFPQPDVRSQMFPSQVTKYLTGCFSCSFSHLAKFLETEALSAELTGKGTKCCPCLRYPQQ